MPTSDPISDFLARIRNAILARHAAVKVPVSNSIRSIASILKEEGYVTEVTEEEGEV